MNDQLQDCARRTLKDSLALCSEAQQLLFKRMYSHENLDLSIDEVINNIPSDKLDWAMKQVERTLAKKNE
jgi:hypothetical protein